MQWLALFFLLVAAAGQVHSNAGVDAPFAEVALGEVPWYAHLRVAVRHSGELRSCAGSLIHRHWLLTSARCIRYNRYIFVRFGVDVFRPVMMAETNTLRVFPPHDHTTGIHDLAIVNLTRHAIDLPNDYYAAPLIIASTGMPVPPTAKFCSYGRLENGEPGERLRCIMLNLTDTEDGYIEASADQGWTTEFDQGAPLVADGVQYGIFRTPEGPNLKVGVFLKPDFYRDWIESILNVTLPVAENTDEDDGDDDDGGNGAEHVVNFLSLQLFVTALLAQALYARS